MVKIQNYFLSVFIKETEKAPSAKDSNGHRYLSIKNKKLDATKQENRASSPRQIHRYISKNFSHLSSSELEMLQSARLVKRASRKSSKAKKENLFWLLERASCALTALDKKISSFLILLLNKGKTDQTLFLEIERLVAKKQNFEIYRKRLFKAYENLLPDLETYNFLRQEREKRLRQIEAFKAERSAAEAKRKESLTRPDEPTMKECSWEWKIQEKEEQIFQIDEMSKNIFSKKNREQRLLQFLEATTENKRETEGAREARKTFCLSAERCAHLTQLRDIYLKLSSNKITKKNQ